MIELTDGPPRIVLAGHLEGDRPDPRLPGRRVSPPPPTELERRGWPRGHDLEIPQGPVCSFEAPGGQRLAIYELRPAGRDRVVRRPPRLLNGPESRRSANRPGRGPGRFEANLKSRLTTWAA